MNPSTNAAFAASITTLAGDLERQSFPDGALYVVATPIGNMADISLRAMKVLSLCSAVACEDTRMTGQLLTRLSIDKPLLAAHQHNEREVADKIIHRLQTGERIALVSDAGTPAISDPGARIVDAVLTAGLRVIPIAGVSAAVAALSVSGLTADQFHFVGFLPARDKQRDTALSLLKNSPATLVFYEAPHRIAETITAMANAFGPDRRILIARELSKVFEQVHRCALAEASDWLASDTNHQRGEFVLLVEAAPARDEAALDEALRVLDILLEDCSVSQAAALTSRITGMKKNQLYEIALKRSDTND
jgi:16S rRNA (cytidine1402-2'-O)-methyltransferase